MRKILLVLGVLLSTAALAFGQYGSSRSSEPQIYQSPEHDAHASYAPLAQGVSLYPNTGYLSAQGERPASDFPQMATPSLGDIARELKKQHELAKKARVVWEN